ncbi:MAG: TRAP transporter substrate-binding protein DctP [Deltaproteobacteria bacterium]|nr:TRAP transporter substrate-binding protein DctP [Deltaproteobacteria bacterium]
MKSGLMCFVLVGCILLGMSPNYSIAAKPEFTLRYAGDYPMGNHITRGMELFAKLVDEKSNGRVKIEVYPASQLFTARDYPRVLPSGGVDMCEVVIGQWSGLVPSVMIFDLAFHFTDWAHMFRVLDSETGMILANELEKKANVKVLYWLQDGSFGFASKVPLKKLEDFKGVRVRSVNEIGSVLITALGGAPTFMGGGEVYMALQRGTVDAGMSSVSSFYTRKYYEVTKYLSGVGAEYGMDACLINLDRWNSLPPDVKQILQSAGKETVVWARQEAVKIDTDYQQLLKDKGMDVYNLPKDEQARWKKASKPVEDYIVKRCGDLGPKLMEAIEKVR